jgi:hypothetical protein
MSTIFSMAPVATGRDKCIQQKGSPRGSQTYKTGLVCKGRNWRLPGSREHLQSILVSMVDLLSSSVERKYLRV